MINFLFGNKIKEEVAKEVANIDDKIKFHCVKLVKSLFSEDAPTEDYGAYGWVSGQYKRTAKGELEKGVVDIVIKKMIDGESERINNKIGAEEFIDKIVDRILKKQIR